VVVWDKKLLEFKKARLTLMNTAMTLFSDENSIGSLIFGSRYT